MEKTIESAALSLSTEQEAVCQRLRELSREKEKLEAMEKALKATLLETLPDGKYFGKVFKLTVYAGTRESFELTDAEKDQIRRFGRAKVTDFRALRIS